MKIIWEKHRHNPWEWLAWEGGEPLGSLRFDGYKWTAYNRHGQEITAPKEWMLTRVKSSTTLVAA